MNGKTICILNSNNSISYHTIKGYLLKCLKQAVIFLLTNLAIFVFSVPALARRVTIGLDSKNPSADEILRDISFEDDPVGGLIPNQMRVGIFLKHIFSNEKITISTILIQ